MKMKDRSFVVWCAALVVIGIIAMVAVAIIPGRFQTHNQVVVVRPSIAADRPSLEIKAHGNVEHMMFDVLPFGDSTDLGVSQVTIDSTLVRVYLPPVPSSFSVRLIGQPRSDASITVEMHGHADWGITHKVVHPVLIDDSGEGAVVINVGKQYSNHIRIDR